MSIEEYCIYYSMKVMYATCLKRLQDYWTTIKQASIRWAKEAPDNLFLKNASNAFIYIHNLLRTWLYAYQCHLKSCAPPCILSLSRWIK